MRLKANLHFHTKEDPEDGHFISYSAREAVERASGLGFEVLAFTLHNHFYYPEELVRYAESKNILLIPGIEKTIEGRHVLILNADEQAEQVQTFKQLAAYRAARPQIFIIAPHPYYYGNISVKEKLDTQPELFDALEMSWFHRRPFDRNIKAGKVAARFGKPFIATSDLHVFPRIENSYAIIETKEKTIEAILGAIRAGRFTNYSRPASWRDIFAQVFLTILNPGELSLLPIFRK